MATLQHTRAQLANPRRKKAGSTGKGRYYHIEVRPKDDFVTFRTQDVGRQGHVQRVTGQRSSGSWATVKWLIAKEDAHIQNGHLVPDTRGAKQVIDRLASKPALIRGDRFEAQSQPSGPGRAKPIAAQHRARRKNIPKAQAARYQK